MSANLSKHSAEPGFLHVPGMGIVFDASATVPSDGAAGYAKGCIIIDTGASAGARVFTNEGSNTSCDFDLLTGVDLTGLLATATEINRAADVSTRIVNVTTTPFTVTEADHDGKILVLDKADGLAITLPAAAAGLNFEFIIKTTISSASTIKSVASADIMIGHAIMGNDSDNTVVNFQAVAGSTIDTIDLLGTGNSTGGMAGQRIYIKGLATNLWYVEIIGDAAGSEATPFANTV